MEKAPVIGTFLAELIKGGEDVSIATIGRFYTLHVTVLPLVVLSLIGIHLLFIQIQGMSEPDAFRALPAGKKKYDKFFFDYLLSEIPLWLCAMVVLVLLATILPRALAPEADPTAAAPLGIKPEWYFLSQYQALKLFPGSLELVGLVVIGAAPLAALAVPFIDREIPSGKVGRLVTWAGVAALVGLVVLTIWGWLS
jgi:cytochrome b6